MPLPRGAARPSLIALSTDPFRGETRLVGPLAEWTRRGWAEATYFTIGFNVSEHLPLQNDLTVLTSGTYVLGQDAIEACGAAGTRLVHDLADAFWLLPADHPKRGAAADATIRAAVNRCTLVTVPTAELAAAARAFGIAAPLAVLPDAPDPAVWQTPAPREPRTHLRVGWSGLPGAHPDDFALLENVATMTAETVEWCFFGDVPAGLEERARGARRLWAPVDPMLYPEALAQLDLDVLVVPRVDSPRNRTKSDAIVRHAAQLGYAVLASDRPALAAHPLACIPDDPAAWIKAVRALGREPARARVAGAALSAAIDAPAAYERMCVDALRLWTGRDA